QYVGQKAGGEVEHLYGTGLVFAPGQVHLVPLQAALKMLQHVDVYREVTGESNGDRTPGQSERPEKTIQPAEAERVSAPANPTGARKRFATSQNGKPGSPGQPEQTDRRRKNVNWDAVKTDYRVGILKVRAIARKHGISPGRICQVAKERGWIHA